MTISQQIAKSLRTGSQAAEEEKDVDIFDIDKHLKSASQKILLERVNFVAAKFPYHFNLNALKSKYINLNPRSSNSSSNGSSGMCPALKNESTSAATPHDGIPTPKMIIFPAEKVEISWRNTMRVGAGLFNLGNTCFLNSALQCLTYTAPLGNYLVHMDHQRSCPSNGQFCMLCAMQKHVRNCWSNSGQSVKPTHILHNLRLIAKHLQFGRQEDAHEFIRYSIDAMQKACLVGHPSKLDVHIKATTAVHQIFGGYLRSRVKCSHCKSFSDTFDPFLDLSLDINKQGCCSLQQCLEMFVRVEVLQGDNAYKCMRCKNTVTAFKKFSVHRSPNILMLQLKRFSNFMGNKINKSISYPSKLNLAPYMSDKQAGGLTYELYGVLVHSGFSCQSGHYYSYVKVSNGQWYCFNDSSVYQVSINQVLNQQAYLLFYTRGKKAPSLSNVKNGYGVSSLNGKPKISEPMTNGTKSSDETRIIGPQLPPKMKRLDSSHSSSFVASSSKQIKQVNGNTPTKAITNGLHDRSKSVSFVVNRKPKLIVSSPSKIVSKVKVNGNNSSTTHKGNEPSTSTADVKTAKPAPGVGDRTSLLNEMLRDSSVPKKHSMKPTPALQALNVYSSSDSDSEEESGKSGYSTLTSTLATLRKSTSAKSNSASEPKQKEDSSRSANGSCKNTADKSDPVRGDQRVREPILQVLNKEIASSHESGGNGDTQQTCSKVKERDAAVSKGKARKRHHSDESMSTSPKFCKSSKSPKETEKKCGKKRRHSDDLDELKAPIERKRIRSPTAVVDKLYRDKKEYEMLMRKKARKEKKQRMENLQVLQNCIDSEDDAVPERAEKKMPATQPEQKKELATQSKREKEPSTQAERKKEPVTQAESIREPFTQAERTKEPAMQAERKREPDTPAERPNVLGQLLKQSSAKAYGVKVDSWDGAESVVENDAKNTWAKLQAPLIDNWNKEYDKGKVKKVKKEPRPNDTSASNIFQKFQNMKNNKRL